MKVKISEVIPFHSVYVNRVEEIIELMEIANDYLFLDDVYPVIQVEKDFIVLDGHHRISAMGLKGKKIETEKSFTFTGTNIEINVEVKNEELFGGKEIRWADIKDIVPQKEWTITSDKEMVDKQKSLITKKIRELIETEVPNDPEGINTFWEKIIENLGEKRIFILLYPFHNFTNPAEWIEISKEEKITMCYGVFNVPYYDSNLIEFKHTREMEYYFTRDMGGGNLEWIKEELKKKSRRYMYIVEEIEDAIYIHF